MAGNTKAWDLKHFTSTSELHKAEALRQLEQAKAAARLKAAGEAVLKAIGRTIK